MSFKTRFSSFSFQKIDSIIAKLKFILIKVLMEFQTFRINRDSPISHHTPSHTTISFIAHCNKTQPTMLQATNILCYVDSIQSETLGDACMIAVLASITMVLHWIGMYLHNNKKSTKDISNISSHQAQKKNHSIATPRVWMPVFKSLSDELQGVHGSP